MTIRELYKTCNHITHETPVQLFKPKERSKYYADDFENLSIERMTFGEMSTKTMNLPIKQFWFERLSLYGDPSVVMILLGVDEI